MITFMFDLANFFAQLNAAEIRNNTFEQQNKNIYRQHLNSNHYCQQRPFVD